MEIAIGLVRHILTLGGGYLVSNGMASADQATQLAGGIIALIGIAASVYAKRKK